MSDRDDASSEKLVEKSSRQIRTPRVKTKHALPTERASVPRQLEILRACAMINRQENRAVTNDDISKTLGIHTGTISNCNPFFQDIGLFTREKNGNLPSDDVIAYADRFKWNEETAANKLAPTFRKAWFCTNILPKLSFRKLTVSEAIDFLADESGASVDHKDQLMMLLNFMKAVGLIDIEGNAITLLENETSENNLQTTTPTTKQESLSANTDAEYISPSQIVTNHLPPFIAGLLEKLPEQGTEWSISGRIKWLITAANIFNLMYTDKQDDGTTTIDITKGKL